jgi:hypothetical protein
MACEKLSKAFRCRSRGVDPDDLKRSHKSIEKTLPQIAREVFRRSRRAQPHDRSEVMKRLGHIARQIELLSPAIDDDGKRDDNCEYPWDAGPDKVEVPIDFSFPNMTLLYRDPAGVLLRKDVLPTVFSDQFEFLT